MRSNTVSVLTKSVAIGFFSGLSASWVMELFQAKAPSLLQTFSRSEGQVREMQEHPTQEPATVVAAEKAAQALLHRDLREDEKSRAGELVHYAIGSSFGIAYSLLTSFYPRARMGLGLPYGTAVFLVADEGMGPALGIAKGPRSYPLSTHVYALLSHLVYGTSLYVGERALGRWLRSSPAHA